MTASPSPALAAEDNAFVAFARACQAAVRAGGDIQGAVAKLTADFAPGWRMPDARYMQLQPAAPYASYLLYLSPESNLSIVLDIFMAGQAAVTHNHLSWGVFTCLEGTERERLYDAPTDLSAAPREVSSRLRPPGVVTLAAPERNAFHQVECAEGERSVSLHLYGSDIGRIERQLWDADAQRYRQFTGGYSNEILGLPVYLAAKDL
ncbi:MULTISPECIES: cysteine dioxygenase family protein [unclassified Chelatococcus]|uniref:cysteine dioxygenase family protein n=1 Tax=unclassified Chelatococcus TaxID=2638111 RepID=UPI001BCAC3BF|nr:MULTISPECIES: cysteine dioxygenase family protein [unclassified Chelatococcus]MBS7742604.1 cysteine dioxygenase family protein [Chelatococcus sp. HY11]MBX3542278.1 cysteine dioxygenase family protein [Chelatococcus sp.]MCO5075504.1 cysteine dioxygenase family protein [Chelatococcus sp.]